MPGLSDLPLSLFPPYVRFFTISEKHSVYLLSKTFLGRQFCRDGKLQSKMGVTEK